MTEMTAAEAEDQTVAREPITVQVHPATLELAVSIIRWAADPHKVQAPNSLHSIIWSACADNLEALLP